MIGASRPEASTWAGGRQDPAARAVSEPGERPPILHYSPDLRPLLAVALGCHGNPDRCLSIGHRRMPICARCTGFVAGNMLGLAVLLAFGPASWAWALAGVLLLAPVAVDGVRQIFGHLSTNPRRLATGILGGVGQILILGAFITALTPRVLALIR